jgi:hypothetical protein
MLAPPQYSQFPVSLHKILKIPAASSIITYWNHNIEIWNSEPLPIVTEKSINKHFLYVKQNVTPIYGGVHFFS